MNRPIDHAALEAIAEALRPIQAEIQALIQRVTRESTPESWDAFVEAIPAINAKIEPYIDAIADATPNSRATLRQVYSPVDINSPGASLDSAFWLRSERPADFVASVSKYSSFDQNSWVNKGGTYSGAPPAEAHPSASAPKPQRMRG